MKIIFVLSLLSINLAFCQKKIVLTSTPQEVPVGKKWVIKTNTEFLVEMDDSGSNPTCIIFTARETKILNFIAEGANGHFGNPNEIYRIVLNEFTQYEGSVYRAKGRVIIDHRADFLDNNSINSFGQTELAFKPGQLISVKGCMVSMQIFEH